MFINTDYLICHVSYNLHTIVKTWPHPVSAGSPSKSFCGRKNFEDIYFPETLCTNFLLKQKKDKNPSSLPLLFSVEKKLYYAFIPAPKLDFLIGPVRLSSPVPMNQDAGRILPPQADLTEVALCNFSDFISQVLLVYNLLHPGFLERDDLVTANCVNISREDTLMADYSSLIFDRMELEQPHNPYDQEFREFTSIELGDLDMLRQSLREDYTGKIGTLAKDEVRHMRNRGIVVVTLASRAAIRGGLLPEIAFSMSDVFIQKLEQETDLSLLLNMMHQFEFKYAEMVAEINARKAGRPKKDQNPRVEQCKDYIFQHLHEKISIRTLAEKLSLNANYLSEIFRQYEGITLTDFILKEKVNLTKNLLTYSPYTYSEIAAYLGFSSQSHLGKVFKKHTGFTLRQYREQYGIREF